MQDTAVRPMLLFAAVGLSIAERLRLGCDAVVVEGPSDQHYMTALTNLRIGAGRLKPGRELVFPPAGGVKGVRAVSSILGGRDEGLPVALFDSDSEGRETVQSLRQTLYASDSHLVLERGPCAGDLAGAEIEDLLPAEILIERLDRWQRAADVPFADAAHAQRAHRAADRGVCAEERPHTPDIGMDA